MAAGHLDTLTLAACAGLLASVGALFWLAGDEDVRDCFADAFGDVPFLNGEAAAVPTKDSAGEEAVRNSGQGMLALHSEGCK